MPQHLATVRIVTGDRTVEPGEPIEPHELAPGVWAGLIRKGCIVEAAEERLAGLPADLKGIAGALPPLPPLAPGEDDVRTWKEGVSDS